MEQWRDIPGYEGMYQASSDGQVRSLPRKAKNGRCKTLRLLKQKTRSDGYLEVSLAKDGANKSIGVHRLVLMAFDGFSRKGVNHIDGIKTNNKLGNLEWATQKENMIHSAYVLGKNCGDASASRKLSSVDVLAIRSEFTGAKGQIAAIARKYGIHFMTASNIIHRVNWKGV